MMTTNVVYATFSQSGTHRILSGVGKRVTTRRLACMFECAARP
jgi:hypothetical protein